MQRLEITRPDDWHVHLRDGEVLTNTVKDIARYFSRVIVMPNLVPPIVNTDQALAYQFRILSQLPTSSRFMPLMTLYLTDDTTPEDIQQAKNSGVIYACKLYPAGATTNSTSGVTSLEKIYPVLDAMQNSGLPLLVHGEITDSDIDVFDREKLFIDRHLIKITEDFPGLKVVMEHLTTKDAVDFISSSRDLVGATITPQHLLYNRNHMLVGGIKPHLYCLPVLKRNIHQQALLEAATSGNSRYFLGTDSAPHAQHAKEAACGCAGCYSATAAIELYAEVFESMDALGKLEAFASFNGADFYGLARNQDRITLVKEEWTQADSLDFGSQQVIPLKAGETIAWKVVSA